MGALQKERTREIKAKRSLLKTHPAEKPRRYRKEKTIDGEAMRALANIYVKQVSWTYDLETKRVS